MDPSQYRCTEGPNFENCTFSAEPALLWTIELPNGRSYTFDYAAGTGSGAGRYGELTGVTLPTGGKVNYTYRLDATASPVMYYNILGNTISSKTIVRQSGTTEAAWTYQYNFTGDFSSSDSSAFTAPDGGQTSHQFTSVRYKAVVPPGGGRVTRITYPDNSVLEREWSVNPQFRMPTRVTYPNPWVSKESLSQANAGGTLVATSSKVMTSDKNGNITLVRERGWVPYQSASTPAVLRTETRAYALSSPDSSVFEGEMVDFSNAYSYATTSTPRDLVARSTIEGPGGTEACSEFAYDTRGNLLSEKRWDSTQGALTDPLASNAVSRSYAYSSGRGNRISETDERSNVVTYTYGDVDCPTTTATDLYVTEMNRGSGGSAQQWKYAYNCRSGLRTRVTDPNSSRTDVTYDRYGRQSVISEGPAGSVLRKTVHHYDDTNLWIATETDVSNAADQRGLSILHFDDLGRIRLQRQFETATSYATAAADETQGIKIETRYSFNNAGNDTLVSNPYRNLETTDSSVGWRVRRLDKSGRLCAEETFSGVTAPALVDDCQASGGRRLHEAHVRRLAVLGVEDGNGPRRGHPQVLQRRFGAARGRGRRSGSPEVSYVLRL